MTPEQLEEIEKHNVDPYLDYIDTAREDISKLCSALREAWKEIEKERKVRNEIATENSKRIYEGVDLLKAKARIERLTKALKMMVDWIGPPPTGPEYFDSLREDAWKEARKVLEEK